MPNVPARRRGPTLRSSSALAGGRLRDQRTAQLLPRVDRSRAIEKHARLRWGGRHLCRARTARRRGWEHAEVRAGEQVTSLLGVSHAAGRMEGRAGRLTVGNPSADGREACGGVRDPICRFLRRRFGHRARPQRFSRGSRGRAVAGCRFQNRREAIAYPLELRKNRSDHVRGRVRTAKKSVGPRRGRPRSRKKSIARVRGGPSGISKPISGVRVPFDARNAGAKRRGAQIVWSSRRCEGWASTAGSMGDTAAR